MFRRHKQLDLRLSCQLDNSSLKRNIRLVKRILSNNIVHLYMVCIMTLDSYLLRVSRCRRDMDIGLAMMCLMGNNSQQHMGP